jgi:hypothetical protein
VWGRPRGGSSPLIRIAESSGRGDSSLTQRKPEDPKEPEPKEPEPKEPEPKGIGIGVIGGRYGFVEDNVAIGWG